MTGKLSPNDAKWVADARSQFIKQVDGKAVEAMRAKCEAIVRDAAGQVQVGSVEWVRIVHAADTIAALKDESKGYPGQPGAGEDAPL